MEMTEVVDITNVSGVVLAYGKMISVAFLAALALGALALIVRVKETTSGCTPSSQCAPPILE